LSPETKPDSHGASKSLGLRNFLKQNGMESRGLGKNWALYQGKTLVGPKTLEKISGL
jgi:hypothetical protein